MTQDPHRPEAPDPLPEDLCREAARLLSRRLGPWLAEGEEVHVSGGRGEARVEVTVRLEDASRDRRTEVTVIAGVPESAPDADAALDLGLDAADAYLGQWLEGGRAERPRPVFQEMSWQGRPVDVRLTVSHPGAEAEADRLLRDRD